MNLRTVLRNFQNFSSPGRKQNSYPFGRIASLDTKAIYPNPYGYAEPPEGAGALESGRGGGCAGRSPPEQPGRVGHRGKSSGVTAGRFLGVWMKP